MLGQQTPAGQGQIGMALEGLSGQGPAEDHAPPASSQRGPAGSRAPKAEGANSTHNV